MRRQWGLPPAHRATTVELRTLYPFVVPDDLGVDGCYIGREASGGLFCFDPWECYAKGKLTSPNMVVFGQIGRGKSAFVKSFVWRQRCFGRQCWVLDPKGEYEALALACGGSPLRLGPGLGLRLNPLDVNPSAAAASIPADRGGHSPAGRSRRTSAGPSCSERSWLAPSGRPLQPEERAAADVALGAAEGRSTVPTLPLVADALLNPQPGQAESARYRHRGAAPGRPAGRPRAAPAGPRRPGRHVRRGDVVRRGAGRGHGRRSTSPACTPRLPWGCSWCALCPGCRAPWPPARPSASSSWTRRGPCSATSPPPAGCRPRSSCSRAYGVANVAVVHRLSDLKAAGQDGSQEQRLAEGLLADAETRVVFGQAPGEAERAGELLGLSRTEQMLLSQLPRGVALWRVGQTSYLVEHELSDEEKALADTDGAMRAAGGGAASAATSVELRVGDPLAGDALLRDVPASDESAGAHFPPGAHFAPRPTSGNRT